MCVEREGDVVAAVCRRRCPRRCRGHRRCCCCRLVSPGCTCRRPEPLKGSVHVKNRCYLPMEELPHHAWPAWPAWPVPCEGACSPCPLRVSRASSWSTVAHRVPRRPLYSPPYVRHPFRPARPLGKIRPGLLLVFGHRRPGRSHYFCCHLACFSRCHRPGPLLCRCP